MSCTSIKAETVRTIPFPSVRAGGAEKHTCSPILQLRNPLKGQSFDICVCVCVCVCLRALARCARFYVCRKLNIHPLVFWVVMSCSLCLPMFRFPG